MSEDARENDKMWHCYEAESKASFSQRVRRLAEWADAEEKLPDVISKPIMKLKKNLSAYSKAYDLPGCHRTSNMVDRLMQRMDRHLFATFYFHGNLQAEELSIEETKANLRQAIELILEDRKADILRGLPDDTIQDTVMIG